MKRFLLICLFVAPAVVGCSKANFSSADQIFSDSALASPTLPQGPQGQPSPSPSPSIVPVQLSPYVNAIAFEDLYYPPGQGCDSCPDYDYNDFLTEFKIVQVANNQNNLTDIYVDFYPRAVGAGYDHALLLALNGSVSTPAQNSNILPQTKPLFNGSAQITFTYYDSNGNIIGSPTNPSYNQDIVVFPSTHGAFGSGGGIIDTIVPSGFISGVPSNYIYAHQNARIHISLDDPSLNPAPANGLIDPSTFRVVLHVINTNYNVDIINVDPNNFDDLGYPWGFIIPTDWQWMQESVKIDLGYPVFSQYRQNLLGQSPPSSSDFMNWFNHPVADSANQYLYPSIPFQEILPAIQ